MVVSTSKQILAQEVDQQNMLRLKSEGNLRDMTRQCQVAKLKAEVQTLGQDSMFVCVSVATLLYCCVTVTAARN